MRLKLFPQANQFFSLFIQSADNTVEGARLYLDLVENFTDPKESHKRIHDLEHLGDETTHQTIHALNTTFVTPIDREDIHGLTTSLDDVMDFIEAASDNFLLHNIDRPTEFAKNQARVLLRACEAVAAAMRDLKRFKGLDKHFVEINQIENDGDQVYRKAIADLFAGDHKALEVLRWKEIYDLVEKAIDRCEDVSNRIESIALKHA